MAEYDYDYEFFRTVIYLINSRAETTVRYSNIILTQQFLSILAISTGVAFLFVVLFEVGECDLTIHGDL